jgi:hypothetical protein
MKFAIYGSHSRIRHSVNLIKELLIDGHEVVVLDSVIRVNSHVLSNQKKRILTHKKKLRKIVGANEILDVIDSSNFTITNDRNQVTKYKSPNLDARLNELIITWEPDFNSLLLEEIRTLIGKKVYMNLGEGYEILATRMLNRAKNRRKKNFFNSSLT